MEILIDAAGIVNKTTGVSQYSTQLLRHLLKLEQKHKYTILIREDLHEGHPVCELNRYNNVVFNKINLEYIGLKRQLNYLWKIKNNFSYDVFHCLYSNYPLCMNKNGVVTIHDLKYLKYPQYLGRMSKLKYYYLYHVFKNAVKICKRIITVSESTRDDLLAFFPVDDPDKIKVIYEAAGLLNTVQGDDGVLSRSGIYGPYFLFVGEHRPHKNIDGLLKAFSYFNSSYPENEFKLVITGKKHPSYKNKLKKYAENAGNKIIFTGFVSDEELAFLYRNCYFFILPSFYEGFGLPILEAMSCGVPVITSSISSMPEISGGAALQINPHDYQDIAEKIKLLVEDKNLYKSLEEKGKKQADKFSWLKAAAETLAIYNEI